jgi:MSHA biogenesis protein MshK
MDEAVMPSTKRGLSPVKTAARAALLGLALAGGAAYAGNAASPQLARSLPDPTRPPAGALPAVDGAPKQESAPQLQSVMIGAAGGHGRIAVIDGQGVRVGDSFRGARVVRIADSAVELQRGGERQVLRLYAPDSASGVTRLPAAASRSGEQR